MIIYGEKVNHLENPLGFELERLSFSWKVKDAAGSAQKEARLAVAAGEDMHSPCLDTGWRADLNALGTAAELPLRPRTRYYWQVSVRSDAGEEASGAVCFFETGKMGEPWQAQWITASAEEKRQPVFCREIAPEAGKEVASARLYICGLGLYEARWNGRKIGCEYLTPYCNNYHARIQYQTFDVTEQLRGGAGELSAELGEGWWIGRFGFKTAQTKQFAHYGSRLQLLAELRIRYTDGSETTVGTDDSWLVRRSQITFSGIYDGEWKDTTLPELPPEKAQLTEAPAGKLTERISLPVTVQQEMPAVELVTTPAGETVYDLGQNIAGIFRLRVHEPAGTEVHVQVCEILQDGNFYRKNYRNAKAEYRFICDGTEQVIEPCFTYYGYRYAKVEGMSSPQLSDFTGAVLSSDLTVTGQLETGNAKVNRLIANAFWSQTDNFIDVPTDCPQRNERMGWTGDAEAFCPTACFNKDSYAFFRKFLLDTVSEQRMNGGWVPAVVPSFGYTVYSSVWGDSITLIPWTMYRRYGDKGILRDAFPGMKMWVDHIRALDGSDHAWRRHFHYGDWLSLDGLKDKDSWYGGTEEGFVADAFYYNSADITAKTAEILGDTVAAAAYHGLAERILKGIRAEYITPAGRCAIMTQTGQVLTLAFGLSEHPEKAAAELKRLLLVNGGRLTTGFVGTPLLCETLTQIGEPELAMDLLLNEEYPGWLYEVNLGATTIWERWNSVLPDGHISDTGMNSLNHYAYGSVVSWIYERVAGLRQADGSVGYRRCELAPIPDRRLGYAEAEYQSASGTWKCGWRYTEDGKLEVCGDVPFGCSACLLPPVSGAEKRELAPGPFRFEYTVTEG